MTVPNAEMFQLATNFTVMAKKLADAKLIKTYQYDLKSGDSSAEMKWHELTVQNRPALEREAAMIGNNIQIYLTSLGFNKVKYTASGSSLLVTYFWEV